MPQKVSRARVVARDLPLRLGRVQAWVERAAVDLLPRGGVVDLGASRPPMVVRAARLDISSTAIGQLARSEAAQAGIQLHVRLASSSSFTANGSVQGMPFSARGQIGTSGGRFTVTPAEVDLTDHGATVHVAVPSATASVHVPTATITSVLARAFGRTAAGGARSGQLANPRLSWTGPSAFTLSGSLRSAQGLWPVKVSGTLAPTPDGKLAIQTGPVQVAVPGAPTEVDLATGMATAEIPQSGIARAIKTQPGWTHGRLRWLGPRQIGVSADIQVASAFAPLVGPEAHLSTTADIGVSGGKVVAVPGSVQVTARGMTLSYVPSKQQGTLHLDPAAIAHALDQLLGSKAKIAQIAWTAPDAVQATVQIGHTPVQVTARLAPLEGGKVTFDITAVQALVDPAGDLARLALDPTSNRIEATLSPAAMSRWVSGDQGTGQVALSPLGGGRMQAVRQVRVLGVPVSVTLEGQVEVEAGGAVAYHVDHASVGGLPVLDALKWAGRTLGSLAGGHWSGNTLILKPDLPAGLHLQSLHTEGGAFQADLAPSSRLADTPAGVRFDGRQLEIDPSRFMPFPGTLTSLSGDATGLTVRLHVDPSLLARQIRLPGGLAFNGREVSVDPARIAGQALPGKLVSISGSALGVQAQIALDPALLQPLRSLPPGVVFSHDRFEIDPRAAGVDGRVVAVSGGAPGVDLQVALSHQGLAGMWRSTVRGVAWNGQTLSFDPSALAPGLSARAQGVHVHGGDLVLDLGDGSPLPAAGGAPGIHVHDPSWVQVQGVDVRGLEADYTPSSSRAPLDLAHLDPHRIRVDAGQVTVPAAKVDALIRKSLSPAQYARYQPRFVNGKIAVRAALGPFRSTIDLSFSPTADGKLALVPDGFLGALVTGGRPIMTLDLAKEVGMQLAPLEAVYADASRLVLTFGSSRPAGTT